MIEDELAVDTGEGTMSTFVTRPDEGGPHPVVLFLMDAPGKREELHDMARRIATTGYHVMLPNLYYRTTDAFELDFGDDESRARMSELMFSIGNDKVVRDIGHLLDHADDHVAADASRVGCVGYCMSGPFALSVAAAHPDRVRAAASIYGVRLAVDADDSPHRRLDDIGGEIYVAHAEHDDHAPPEMVERFALAVADSGVRGRIETYPGTHHGFAFPDRSVYDKAAAETHWARLHDLFARNLRA